MSKVVLKNAYLLNWYGFVNKTIPIGDDLTLITGENECGKSTILDAIKYAFIGDVDFNKATSASKVGTGKRTISSYTRCLTNPDKKTFARPSNVYAYVYTHIALEYYDELHHTKFVLGVIIETNPSDLSDSYWYSLENKTLNDISFLLEKGDKKLALSAKEFRDQNSAELLTKSIGITKFMTMVGLKFQGDMITTYQRKLKNLLTYKPDSKIQQFMKESILQQKNINLKKLQDSKRSIDEITISLNLLKNEIDILHNLLQAYDNYHYENSRLIKNNAKILYKNKITNLDLLEKNYAQIEIQTTELKTIESLLETSKLDLKSKNEEYQNARRQLEEIDGAKAIADEEKRLELLEVRIKDLNKSVESIRTLYEKIINFNKHMQASFEVSNLLDFDIDVKVKIKEIEEYKHFIENMLNELYEDSASIKQDRTSISKQLTSLVRIIDSYDRNLPDYSNMQNQVRLKNEINKKFKELNIDSEAKFASTFVLEIKNEEWRNTIETYLGIHRYSIIVEPEYFYIANEVLDQSKFKYVELVNTKLLSTKEFKIEEDSLMNLLVIKNEIARKYFAFLLGRIHAVDIKDVPKYERAVSKEGKLSRNMIVTFLDFRRLQSYCLGEDAIKLNKEIALKEKAKLEKEEKELLDRYYENNRQKESVQTLLILLNKDYDYYALEALERKQNEMNECIIQLEKLKLALKQNTEYLSLSERIDKIQEEVEQLHKLINDRMQSKAELEQSIRNANANIENITVALKDINERLEQVIAEHPKEYNQAKEEFDNYRAGVTTTGDVMSEETRKKVTNSRSKYHDTIIKEQGNYWNSKRIENNLSENSYTEADFRRRYTRLKFDDLEEVTIKLNDQTKKYESIFKNEFVLKIKANIEEALLDIREINKQLKKLKFSTMYQFDVKIITGTSDYAKIVEYADYLKKTNRINGDQMILGEVYDYDSQEVEKREAEIKEIVNRIISKSSDDMLNDFADYRNYMEYEVLVDNDEIPHGRLSTLAGYNSGAGTQIPYTIILSAALSILYNDRLNSSRLIFMDEPFEKMSDRNIKIMLNFFKSQNFQVIFCAPPNKLDSIGKECDVIIPVKKISNSNMVIGRVQFNESV